MYLNSIDMHFKGSYANWSDKVSLTAVNTIEKIPAACMGNLLLRCWSRQSKRFPKQYRLLILSLITSQNLKVRPY